MHGLSSIACVIVATVFASAAWGKFRRLCAFRSTLEALGFRGRVAIVLAVVVPFGEALVAAGFLSPCSLEAALSAILLLTGFSAVLANAARRGTTVSCRCFGTALDLRPGLGAAVSVTMSCASLYVLADGVANVEGRTIAVIASGFVILTCALSGYGLFKGRMPESTSTQTSASASRAEAPLSVDVDSTSELTFTDPTDGSRHLLVSILPAARMLALVFVSPNCKWCGEVIPELETWAVHVRERMEVMLVSSGGKAALRKSRGGGLRLLLQIDDELDKRFGVVGVPSMLFLLPDGSVGGQVIGGVGPMRQAMALLAAATGPLAQ